MGLLPGEATNYNKEGTGIPLDYCPSETKINVQKTSELFYEKCYHQNISDFVTYIMVLS